MMDVKGAFPKKMIKVWGIRPCARPPSEPPLASMMARGTVVAHRLAVLRAPRPAALPAVRIPHASHPPTHPRRPPRICSPPQKAEFAFKHFEADPNMSFALVEEDPVTKHPVRARSWLRGQHSSAVSRLEALQRREGALGACGREGCSGRGVGLGADGAARAPKPVLLPGRAPAVYPTSTSPTPFHPPIHPLYCSPTHPPTHAPHTGAPPHLQPLGQKGLWGAAGRAEPRPPQARPAGRPAGEDDAGGWVGTWMRPEPRMGGGRVAG